MNLIYSPNTLKFLDRINYPEIDIKAGSFTFLSGKSGTGKSTYLKLLNQTILPSNGTIYYQGQDISTLPILSYRKKILLVPQELFLLDTSIEENFRFYYDARQEKLLSPTQMKEFLSICQLSYPITADCRVLSGGERQRVFLSIFLSCSPKVLLLDEPTSALDETTSIALFESIKHYCHTKEITVISVCHNNQLIKRFADTIIQLEDSV